jgi:hypothetical protein
LNRPLNYSDPTGHCPNKITVCIIGGGGEGLLDPIQGECPFDENNPYSSLIDTEFEGAGTMVLELTMLWLWKAPAGKDLDNALKSLAEIRGLEFEDVQRQYVTFYRLKMQASTIGNHNGQDPVAGTEDSSWWGSTEQLRFGKIVGDAFGIDPVFGALLSPTGGRIGGGDSKILHRILRSNEAVSYHGQVHDAAGYLYNYHNSGPGYTYARPDAPVSQRDDYWMGQASGIQLWEDLLVDKSN